MHEVFKMHFLNQKGLNKEKWKEGGREKQEKLPLFILNFIIVFCIALYTCVLHKWCLRWKRIR